MFKRFQNLPSIVYVVLIPIAIAAFIGGIIVVFELIATQEGFASLLFLIIGLLVVIVGANASVSNKVKEKSTGFTVAMGIVFFALMGMAIDQPGNIVYNKPIEILFCPTSSYLSRDAIVTHPLPGRTDINEDFTCVDALGKETLSIDVGNVLLVRFVEYVVIGYAFLALRKLIEVLKGIWSVSDNQTI